MNPLTEKRWLLIHNALHSEASEVFIAHQAIPVKYATNGCRKVDWSGATFMTQNIYKNSIWATKAKMGHKITWVIRPGNWGRIVDEKIEQE